MQSTLIGGDHHGKQVFHDDGMDVIWMPQEVGPPVLFDDSNALPDDKAVTVLAYTRREVFRGRKKLHVFALAGMTDKEVLAAVERG